MSDDQKIPVSLLSQTVSYGVIVPATERTETCSLSDYVDHVMTTVEFKAIPNDEYHYSLRVFHKSGVYQRDLPLPEQIIISVSDIHTLLEGVMCVDKGDKHWEDIKSLIKLKLNNWVN